jgi:hypothetical protein
MWIDVDRCEQRVFSCKKDHFIADSGYSGTPLTKKLGIKPEMKVLIVHKPDAYFEWLGADISEQFVAKKETPDITPVCSKHSRVQERSGFHFKVL